MPGPHGAKFTQAVQAAVVDAIGKGHTIRDACALAGIHHTQFYRWMERGEQGRPGSAYRAFFDAVKAAEAELMGECLDILTTGMKDDPKWAAWMLERRRPADYGKPEKVEHSGPDGGPLVVELKWQAGPLPPGE